MFVAIVSAVEIVLLEDELVMKVDEGFQARYHPSERYVSEFLINITPSRV